MAGAVDRPAGDAGRWDFFVSYTGADRVSAEWVAWVLEDAGYRVLLQAWDFVPGTNWTVRMQLGIARSTRTIAIVSDAYLRSAYGRAEWQAAWAADPDGAARKLLPVRVADCAYPALMGSIVAINLYGLTDDEARAELLGKIEAALLGRDKPRVPPTRPTARPPARRADATAQDATASGATTSRPARPWSRGRVTAECLAGVAGLAAVAAGLATQSAGAGGAAGIVAGVVAAGLAASAVAVVLTAAVTRSAPEPTPTPTALVRVFTPGLLGAVIGALGAAVTGAGHKGAAAVMEIAGAALVAAVGAAATLGGSTATR